jgi:hypothetical protein
VCGIGSERAERDRKTELSGRNSNVVDVAAAVIVTGQRVRQENR